MTLVTGAGQGSIIITYDATNRDACLDIAADLGMKYFRFSLDWDGIEPTQGSFSWSAHDALINAAVAKGLEPIGILGYGAAWSNGGSGNVLTLPSNSTQRGYYATYVTAAVNRWKDRVKVWEMWNEPNLAPNADTSLYTALLSAGYDAAKAEDPDCIVLPGGLANDAGALSMTTWVTALYADVPTKFDAVNLHPYNNPYLPAAYDSAYQRITDVRAIMVANSDATRQIWLTEYGAPTGSGDGAVTAAIQARTVRQILQLGHTKSWMGPVIIHEVRDHGTNLADPEDNFGLVENDYDPKPSYHVMRMASEGYVGAAIERIGSTATSGTTGTMPAGVDVGDLILHFGYRNNNATAPGAPSGFTVLNSSGANTNSATVSYKYAASSSDAVGAATNATHCIVEVWRNAFPGAVAVNGGSSTSIGYPALTLTTTEGSSQVTRIAGHRSATNMTTNAPDDWEPRSGIASAVRDCDPGGVVVANISAHTQSVNANSGWRAYTIELRERPPKIATVIDDFAATDDVKWVYNGAAAVSGGQLAIPVSTSYDNADSQWAGDLTGSEVVVKMVQRPNAGNGSTGALLLLLNQDNDTMQEIMAVEAGNLVCREVVSGTENDTTVTWSGTDHAWWRIRESAGTIYWDTSPDGMVWTNRRSKTSGIGVPLNMGVVLMAGYWDTEPSPGTAMFDNLNLRPSLVGGVKPTIVGANANLGQTVTIPAHQVGDEIILFAFDYNSATLAKPSAGGTVPAWVDLDTKTDGSSFSARTASFRATATNHTSGTWGTFATRMIAVVVRGASGIGPHDGAFSQLGPDCVAPAVPMQQRDGTSVLLHFHGTRQLGGVTFGQWDAAPAGYTRLAETTGASQGICVNSKDDTASDGAAGQATTSATGNAGFTVEVLPSVAVVDSGAFFAFFA